MKNKQSLATSSIKAALNPDREVAVLKVIAEAQNTELDINVLQFRMIKSISDLFKANEAVLILLDNEHQELAIQKRLGAGSEWESQISLKIEPGLIQKCIQGNQPLVVDDLASDEVFNTGFDAPEGLKVQSILCAPIIANGQTLGALALYDVAGQPLSSYEMGLIMSMTIALANAMYSSRLFQQLKVSNADLEVSRWELLHSRNTLRSLFDSIPASIYIVDRKYNLVAVNMSRAERAHSKPNSLVGKICYEKLFQRNEPCAGCRVSETLMSWHSTSRINRQWVNKEQFLEWEITTFAVQDETNLPLQAIILEQDVTEKRRLEANLIQSEKLAAVGQLAAGVAHEINNPLAAIIANAQILQHDLPPGDNDLQESVKLIEMAGVRASQVVRNLLGFARKEQYEFSPIDLNETIQNALSLLQHEFMSRPITLRLELASDLPRIVASKDHLQGVWINMILNAFDAVDQEKGEIVITTKYQSNEFHVVITDNGKGIPQERLTHIFEPFYTTKAPGRGTGLGLSVCQRIVKQHGGYIQVESQVDKGTKFTIILPAAPV